MLFIVSWSISPESRNSAVERFLRTGGQPPEGVSMRGRWHAVGRMTGIALADADDPAKLQAWLLDWNDLMHMEAYPVLTDEQAAPLMARVLANR